MSQQRATREEDEEQRGNRDTKNPSVVQLEKQRHSCINREVKEILSLELSDRIWDRIIMSMRVAGWPEFGLTPKPEV